MYDAFQDGEDMIIFHLLGWVLKNPTKSLETHIKEFYPEFDAETRKEVIKRVRYRQRYRQRS